jgi:flagellar basal-body rod modification protein FlgD
MSSIPAIGSSSQNQIDPLTGKVGPASTSSSSSSTTKSAAAATGTSSLANESTFLTLLVAQLKNQDPAQPADGTQFITQLAQFTTLEQNLAMRTDLDSINKNTTSTAVAASGSTSNKTQGTAS